MAKFKKVEVTEEATTFQEQGNREVDAEIIEAMKEGQAKIEELEADNKALLETSLMVKAAAELTKEKVLELARENTVLREQLKPKDPPKINRKRWSFIRDLRSRDTPGITMTCASCTRRCNWKEMDYGKSDFCQKCLGK